MSGEKFCLKWNDFESNISHAFRDLRSDGELFDVTLACSDDNSNANKQLIQAHKVILSACSPFFRNLLRQLPMGPSVPVIYLRGIKHQDMEAVLSFMYHGEVNVAQDNLNSFLSVAEDLKVKGLTQNKTNDTKSPEKRDKPGEKRSHSPTPGQSIDRPSSSNPSSAKRSRASPVVVGQLHGGQQASVGGVSVPVEAEEDDDIQEVVSVKPEPKEAVLASQSGVAPGNVVESEATAGDLGYENQEEEYLDETYDDSYDQYSENYMGAAGAEGAANLSTDAEKGADRMFLQDYITLDRNIEGAIVYTCKVCGKQDTGKRNLINHIESRHFPSYEYHCHLCNKTCKSKNAYNVHNSRYHKSRPILPLSFNQPT